MALRSGLVSNHKRLVSNHKRLVSNHKRQRELQASKANKRSGKEAAKAIELLDR